jgi:hypothetical protein
MTFKEMQLADLEVIYNHEEFAKECIFKGKKVAVFSQVSEMDIFEIPAERIKALNLDFIGLEEGDELEIDSVLYTVMNFSPVKDFQISIAIKKKYG